MPSYTIGVQGEERCFARPRIDPAGIQVVQREEECCGMTMCP
jgi:hypothetical protein